ncbi:MAG: zf-HC2 domain-containing protein [Vicinamibacteria bacterium]|nr:zf-HC2 domain-containing protein [Vicinamibacteria bacterium]
MMSCREVYGFLDEFLESRLDDLTKVAFAAHLLLCPACRNYLATYRATLLAAREAEWADCPPTEIPEELIAAILASRTAAVQNAGDHQC